MSPAPTARFDVVVVAYRSEDHIATCLRAVQGSEVVGQVVVVDHGDGESARRATALGARSVHDPSNPGFGRGQNRGVGMTQSPYVLILNPDAVVHTAAIARGIELLERRPDVAAVQGTIRSSAGGGLERSQGRELGPVHLVGRALSLRRLLHVRLVRMLVRRVPAVSDHVERAPSEPTDTEWLAATAVLVRRTAFEQIGGFSTDYFLYGEDLDLCRRFRQAGWRLLALPDEWAVHDSGASAASSVDREITWWNGTMTFAATWWHGRAWATALLAATVQSLRLVARSPRATPSILRQMLLQPLHRHRRRMGASKA